MLIWRHDPADLTALRLLETGDPIVCRATTSRGIAMYRSHVAESERHRFRCARGRWYFRDNGRQARGAYAAYPMTEARAEEFAEFERRAQAIAYIQAFDMKGLGSWETADLLTLAQVMMQLSKKSEGA